ncbi:hypothetical protein GHT06_010255 [Daphnia sinensis]|uniref:Uncharacterized protein n=1 Tax=Daphnia sinensis TaxID=1820382 RepID=A0AAD5Q0Z1_9CRUS|nr:hypothetical protein GHT06_010255 [Daphnia sinensis]
MNRMVMLISAVAMVASAPTQNTVINVDGPEGRHVQTGEPGKAVSGYFTSRDEGGVEYKTRYEADEKGFRATGLHLPVSPAVSSTWPLQYPIAAFPNYDFRYGPQNYLPFAYPTYPQDSLSYERFGFKQGVNQFPVSGDDVIALAKSVQIALTEEEKDALKGRDSLTFMMLPLTLLNTVNLVMLKAIQQMVMALCLTTLVASAPSDVRPLTVDTDKAEAREVKDAVKPANPAWGYFTTHTVDGKSGYTATYKGDAKQSPALLKPLPFNPFAFQPYPGPAMPGLRYFPANYFPSYYAGYPQVNYGQRGQYETKSDELTAQEYEDALRLFGLFNNNNGGAIVEPEPAPAPAPAPATNPMAGVISKLITMNNFAILKLIMANAAMMVAG